ncbi:MAG: GTPase ObgE [Verrucomicrobiales bacterium]|nr:GTPase ObgE [Verrucomicrobiales bacterium]
MFVDHIKVQLKAGNGGNGSASFRRTKTDAKGGPDGGDGGKGGDIVLQVDQHTDNLKAFFYQPLYKADEGKCGTSNRKTGKSGKTLVMKVPAGTIVYRGSNAVEIVPIEAPDWGGEGPDERKVKMSSGYEEISEEEALAGEPLADLTEVGQKVVLCKGGDAGKGNVNFKSATNQAPKETIPGGIGEEAVFYLELRKIADAGLVGFPNAGKSTLLRALSAATPKVAAYPFTTLKPMVGVVDFKGFSRGTIADIPGLIEGAHKNVGLGHEFLRHIMRCRLLMFVADMAGTDGDDRHPIIDIQMLRKEIKLYNEDLAAQPWIIIANKMDLPESQANLEALQQRFPKIEVIPISGSEDIGLDALKTRLRELIGQRPE